MKLSHRVSLLTGLLVFAVVLTVGTAATIVSFQTLEETAEKSLLNQAVSGADMVHLSIQSQLDILQELADRVGTRSMDWEIQQPSLAADVDSHNYLDLAVVTYDGVAHYIKDDTISNLADRDYVIKALAGQQVTSDVIISRVIGKPVVMFAVPIRDGAGRTVGALVGRRDGSALHEVTKNVKVGETGYSYMVNGQGIVIAHQNADLVMNQFNPQEEAKKDSSLVSLAGTITTAQRVRTGVVSYIYNKVEMEVGFTPVADYAWTLFVTIERKELLAGIDRLVSNIVLFGVISVLLGIILSYFIGRSIAKPITRVTQMLKDISEGEGDLTRHIDIISKDEIGELAHYFNQTLERIRALIIIIKGRATVLHGIGEELSTNMGSTAQVVGKITAHINHIRGDVISQSASVNETHATMETITRTIGKLSEQIEQQSISLEQSSRDIEELLASIQTVSATLIKNGENVTELAHSSEIGRGGLQEVVENIREIERASAGVMEINAVMENIAAQTNLLSMNAAIEAAHAGEAGKGFAVVADEIRKLAESSSEQSKIIADVLKRITLSIAKITQSADEVLNKFEAIDAGIKTVSREETNIRSAMENQDAESERILENTNLLNETTAQVKKASTEMLEGSKEVIKESGRLGTVSANISNRMNEMAVGAEQIDEAINQVTTISGKNKETIDILVQEVARFKVETKGTH
ncbi:MAG: methyl-accepting chemotaxis protein [Treponema sp.]|jgi:methyl-accepting chemotaxis protein|nr:methyl-accepting chemotaxis protein [Treponema sp.]